MRQFHSLTVSRVDRETPDSIRVGLDVPDELQTEFAFLPGQHLPIEISVDGKRVRRTYSICSAPGDLPLEIGVRVQEGGRFSGFVAERLQVGDQLQVMPPVGQFHADVDSGNGRDYVAFAAGSGITPILSIARSVLDAEPASRVALFYGNRNQRSTMFIDDLYALKNRYPERLQLQFIFSREPQEFPLMDGRLDADKVRELYKAFCGGIEPSGAFVCGPGTMVATVTDTLVELGMEPASIHVERFGAPRKPRPTSSVTASAPELDRTVDVTVIMDGHRRSFRMAVDGINLVDAAAQEGIDLPYSCKGGVCASCRTYLRSGAVRMDSNYGLEPWEIEKGYILACQSQPEADELVLDYDRT